MKHDIERNKLQRKNWKNSSVSAHEEEVESFYSTVAIRLLYVITSNNKAFLLLFDDKKWIRSTGENDVSVLKYFFWNINVEWKWHWNGKYFLLMMQRKKWNFLLRWETKDLWMPWMSWMSSLLSMTLNLTLNGKVFKQSREKLTETSFKYSARWTWDLNSLWKKCLSFMSIVFHNMNICISILLLVCLSAGLLIVCQCFCLLTCLPTCLPICLSVG